MKDKYLNLRKELLNVMYMIHISKDLDVRDNLEERRKEIQKDMKIYLIDEKINKRK